MAFLDETGLSELWACVNKRASKLANTVWKKYKSYTTAGSYTWTAPDISGDGSDYLIGVIVIGGGGSGGASVKTTKKADDDNSYAHGGGGASGYATGFVMTVTPGKGYAVVVGSGGAKKTATIESSNTYKNVGGGAGGTSSFNGVTASGGGAGKTSNSTTPAAISVGGMYGGTSSSSGLYGGKISTPEYLSSCDPLCCFNPFEGTRILGSGGGANAYMTTSSTYGGNSYNGGKSPITGKGGGNGAYHSGSAGTATATAGNEPGPVYSGMCP